NGPQSNSATWPTLTSTSSNFSLSQTAITLAPSQSTTVTAANMTGSVYLSNNSNPPIANVNINSNQITFVANSIGSTVVTICTPSSPTACISAYVTVQNGSVSALNLTPSQATLSPSQSVPITISGGTGVYTVLSNSNSGSFQTSLSGNTL